MERVLLVKIGIVPSARRTGMVAKTREIDVPPGSELARIIDESESSPVYLVKDGVRYRLVRTVAEDVIDENVSDDEEDENAILDKIIGSWKHLDVDKLTEELQIAREESSRPTDWPGLSRLVSYLRGPVGSGS